MSKTAILIAFALSLATMAAAQESAELGLQSSGHDLGY